MNAIKNIIFDFGNVLIDLNISRITEKYIQILGFEAAEKAKEMLMSSGLLPNYETGKINEEEFLKGFKAIINIDELSLTQIRSLWCAMLDEIPRERIEMLKLLKKNYNLYILSNINQTHADFIHDYLLHKHGISEMEWRAHFDKIYYSHEIGFRKPNADIYAYLLKDAQLQAKECLFIDDLAENTAAAGKFGIQTYTHVPSDNIVEVLRGLSI